MFFILDTAQRLGFTQILAQIEPASPQGRKAKKALTPFLPGEEAAFDRMTKRLRFWLEFAGQTRVLETVRPLLAGLRSMEGILERLTEGRTLDEGECFEIKANLVTARVIWEELWEMSLAFIQSNQNIRGVLPEWMQEYTFERVPEVTPPQWRLKVMVDPAVEPGLEPEEIPDWLHGCLDEIIAELKEEEPVFRLDPIDPLWELLNPGGIVSERFYLRDEYDPELAAIRQELNTLQREIKNRQREELADVEARLGRSIAASGELMVSKSDEEWVGYLKTQPHWRIERENFNAYFFRYVPGAGVQALEEQRKAREAEEERIVRRVLAALTDRIRPFAARLLQNQESLGELDWMLAKVRFAMDHMCVPAERAVFHRHARKPNRIQIRNGRHLPVEADVKARGTEYTPIDVTLHDGVTIITGSNMGGKTLNLRMIGLLTAMAQYGLYVSADHMRLTLQEFIYFSVDDDHTKGDLSTFGQEIVGLNQALPRKNEAGLILIDELARGTNPEEGSALGRAIIKYLLDAPSVTVLTTHFAALTRVAGVRHLKVLGLNQAQYEILQTRYRENAISLKMINHLMDYHLVEVGASEEVSRDAIRVAALLGLDHTIIAAAEQEMDGDI